MIRQPRVERGEEIVRERALAPVQRARTDHDDEHEEQREQPIAERAAHLAVALGPIDQGGRLVDVAIAGVLLPALEDEVL